MYNSSSLFQNYYKGTNVIVGQAERDDASRYAKIEEGVKTRLM